MHCLTVDAQVRPGSKYTSEWDDLGGRPTPNWYLDRLVAEQKRREHQKLIRRWTDDISPATILKTDVFEEAHGRDQILFDLFDGKCLTIGMDVAFPTVAKAQRRCPVPGIRFYAGDVRRLPLRNGSIGLVLLLSARRR